MSDVAEIAYHLIEARRHAEQARAGIAAMTPRHDSPEHHAQIHIAGAKGAAERAISAWERAVREVRGE